MRYKLADNPLDILKGTEVMDEGRRVVRPDVMQFLVQAASLSQLVKMRKLEESKVSTKSISHYITVSDRLTVVDSGEPLISFTIINDGPGLLYYRVNRIEGPLRMEAPVMVGQAVVADFEYPVIERIYLTSAVGATSVVRIFGKVGVRQE